MTETYEQLIKSFPSQYQPRPIQLEILRKIAKGLDQGRHTILLDAGTGIGKSAIAITLSRYFASSYIVTVTKQLQDQYHDDFGFQVLKGRNNWDCRAAAKDKDRPWRVKCDDGICQVRTEDYECNHGVTLKEEDSGPLAFHDKQDREWNFRTSAPCEYWEQKATAINSNISLLNYNSYFLELNYLPHFKGRVLNVFDEAHKIEDQLMDQISINLSNQRIDRDNERIDEELRKLGEDSGFSPVEIGSIREKIPGIPRLTIDDYTEIVEHILPLLMKLQKVYEKLSKSEDLHKKTRKSMANMARKLDNGIKELEEHPNEWVIDPNQNKEKIDIKPIEVSRYCQEYFFRHGIYNLLMSATILDRKSFSRWHDLDPEDVIYIHVKSPFKVENRPIIIDTAGPMSRQYIKTTKPRTIPKVQRILERHKNEKGLIHTNSHPLAVYLYDNLNDPRISIYSFKTGKSERDDAINKFKKSDDPLVLVGPSVHEGVDLPGDLCRFQIIYKVPFPYRGDKQILARQTKDPDWYAYKTVTSLVQAYGRGMRNEDDYCTTYIMDGSIDGVLNSAWMGCLKFLPEYFTEAIR